MNRLMMFLAASTALAGCATDRRQSSRWPRRSPPSRRRRRSAAPRQARARHLRLRHRRHGYRRSLPGDNFYQFANGTWAKNTPIPADKSNYGMFTVLDDLSRERTRGDHRGSGQGPDEQDRHRLRQLPRRGRGRGQGPGAVRAVARTRSAALALARPSYAAAVAPRPDRIGIGTPFGGFVGQDDKTARPLYPRRSCQAGLGMPDRDYYLSNDAKLVETRAKYLAPSDQHADAGRRGQCRRARQGDPRLRNQDRQGALDPRSTAATRPRPTT